MQTFLFHDKERGKEITGKKNTELEVGLLFTRNDSSLEH